MYIKNNRITQRYIQALILVLLFLSHAVNANVGKIIYAYGNNYALDSDGNRRDIKRGAEINEGDTLVTGRGRMQIRLIDGGFVSIYPNSEYRIEQYKFTKVENTADVKEQDSKDNRGFFNLIKGAARQITGILGGKYNENFKFRTTVATIGIRGTGFFARLCQADCFDAEGNPMQDGMYVKNNTGVITMTTNAGEVALAQGQSAFAASSEDSPQQAIQPPIAYNIVTPDIELYDFDEKVVSTKITDVDTINPPVLPPVNTPAVVVKNMEFITSRDLVSTTTIQSINVSNADNSVVQKGDAIEHFETIEPELLMPVVFDKGSATLVDKGADTTLRVIWNRWSGGFTYTQGGQVQVTLDDNIHLIGSDNITPDLASLSGRGFVNYASAGGTAPTVTGVAGNQTGTQTVLATLNLDTQEVTNFQLDIIFSNIDMAVNTAMSTSPPVFLGSTSGNIVNLTGSCSGTDCGGNGLFVSGKASVNLVGPNAEGIYGTYNLTNIENAISGSYLATEAAASGM